MTEPTESEVCRCGHDLADHWPDEEQHHSCDECECEGYAVVEDPA